MKRIVKKILKILTFGLLAKMYSRSQRVCYEVLIRKKHDKSIFDNDFGGFMRIPNTTKCWAADPFVAEDGGGNTFVFCELANKKTYKGCIAFTKWPCGHFQTWKICIKEKWHLSFPNIITCLDKTYMMCESIERKEIYLYEMIQFPKRWKRIDTPILKGNYCDSEMFSHNGNIYLITYKTVTFIEEEYLCIFKKVGDSFCLIKEIRDANNCYRPAGKVFIKNGELLFPTQNSRTRKGKPSYGYGMILNKIIIENESIEITPVSYIDSEDYNFYYKSNINHIHTYNRSENYEVIDIGYIYKRYFYRVLIDNN